MKKTTKSVTSTPATPTPYNVVEEGFVEDCVSMQVVREQQDAITACFKNVSDVAHVFLLFSYCSLTKTIL